MVIGSRMAAAGLRIALERSLIATQPEALAPDAELVQVARGPRGVPDRAGDRLRGRGHEPGAEAAAAPERVAARPSARTWGPGRARGTRARRRTGRCTPRPPRATSWFTNGICGLANQVISGMPSADCTTAAGGVEPTIPSTSAAVEPGVAEDADARVERERCRAHLAAIVGEASGRGVRDRDAVLDRIS